MKRWMYSACVAWLVSIVAIGGHVLGQSDDDAWLFAELDASAPLAGMVGGTMDPQKGDPARLRRALDRLDAFESFNDPGSVAVFIRVMLEAAAVPGTSIMLYDIKDGSPVVGVFATSGEFEEDDGARGNVAWTSGDGQTWLLYDRNMPTDPKERSGLRLLGYLGLYRDAFAGHRPTAPDGIEFFLDLENLRRAWPESLANGPARRVVAVTGLANARKIHVHVPEQGAVRLAYSSRALVPEDISTRTGPAPAVEGRVGVRWPAVFDAGLRTYAVALDDTEREAFAKRFQEWMSVNGGRLRGIIQAVEIAAEWSVSRSDDDGLRVEVSTPVRQGIDTVRLVEAVIATLANSGFEVDGKRGELALPEAIAAAVGGTTLAFEVDDSAEPVVVRITIE